jgi:hypothetical protein
MGMAEDGIVFGGFIWVRDQAAGKMSYILQGSLEL